MKAQIQIDGEWLNPADKTQPIRKLVRKFEFTSFEQFSAQLERHSQSLWKDYQFIQERKWKTNDEKEE